MFKTGYLLNRLSSRLKPESPPLWMLGERKHEPVVDRHTALSKWVAFVIPSLLKLKWFEIQNIDETNWTWLQNSMLEIVSIVSKLTSWPNRSAQVEAGGFSCRAEGCQRLGCHFPVSAPLHVGCCSSPAHTLFSWLSLPNPILVILDS